MPARTGSPCEVAVADAARRRTRRLDHGRVLTDAVGERDLTGARDICAVIDARIRRRAGALTPVPVPPWSAQASGITDPQRRTYAEEIAALMDARKQRMGEHRRRQQPALGGHRLWPRPRRPCSPSGMGAAGRVGRRVPGTVRLPAPRRPVGPEPATGAPDLRAASREALAAVGPADGPDVRGMPDGRLLHQRDTYPIETAWAPPWVGDQLRQARTAARDAHLAALRAAAEVVAARNP